MPRDQSIQIASYAEDPDAIVRQMAVHAFRYFGTFSRGEWQTLAKAAGERGWIEKRHIRQRYAQAYGHRDDREDLFLETAIAEEYARSDPTSYIRSARPDLAVFKLIEDGVLKARQEKRPAGKQPVRGQGQPRSFLLKMASVCSRIFR